MLEARDCVCTLFFFFFFFFQIPRKTDRRLRGNGMFTIHLRSPVRLFPFRSNGARVRSLFRSGEVKIVLCVRS